MNHCINNNVNNDDIDTLFFMSGDLSNGNEEYSRHHHTGSSHLVRMHNPTLLTVLILVL